ncbi:Protein TIC 22-like, chloroplastic [Ananas comosus]|uniref:Protein TIC 22-like, chloroplastic n=1 Tax=Ananas comosus TaxID=4615 RepID=A0A199VUS7_ANACO|nr:Protein TIC 22-like, chloroplastic [Ananas comosus]
MPLSLPWPWPWPNPRSQSPSQTPTDPRPFFPPNPLTSLLSHISTASSSPSLGAQPLWARVVAAAAAGAAPAPAPAPAVAGQAPARVAIEERLAGVPVYALSNSAEEFVLVSGARTGKSLGLFCFSRGDAEALLEQMRSMNADMREGSKVVTVALNKERKKLGDISDGFPGVPVFQSRSLVLKSQNKRYRPFFFRKEDLEDSLSRASRQQRQLNPALRHGDIQVCALEEIINAMKDGSSSKWDDAVFIPPGFNVSTDLSTAAA